jgi:type II secretory pathway pseudopilin PulG
MTGRTAVRAAGQEGFTLIDMLFVVALIGMLSTLAIPGLMRARNAAQSSSALGMIRIINSAQLSFAITCGLGFYAPDFPALGAKPTGALEGFLPPELSSGSTFLRSGYNFSMAATSLSSAPPSCNGLPVGRTGPAYAVVADQLDDATVPRFFGSNADGAIFEHSESLAATMPETGAPPSGAPVQR